MLKDHSFTQRLANMLHLQLLSLFLWGVFCFALGIGLYFALRFEPPLWVFWGFGAFWGLCMALFARWRGALTSAVLLLGLCALGFCWAGLRAHWAAAPVLEKRIYAQVTGRIVGMDLSAARKPRLLMDQVVIADRAAHKTPKYLRISLHQKGAIPELQIGQMVQARAHLSPPPARAEPYAFDFQRHAWFLQLGAVGYSRKNVQITASAPHKSWRLWVNDLRHKWAGMLRSQMPERTAGIAIAITAGLRADLDKSTVRKLRHANLSHLLAISGLHMGLVSALIFSGLRLLLAAVPFAALNYPIRQICAALAMSVGAVYLLFSGASIATERAFIMTAVILGAVILSKRAITLRAVAIAACIVLVLRPQAILSAGFQMSFAATIALVYVFEWISRAKFKISNKPTRWVLFSCISAAVAGAATSPFVAAHFNVMSHYGVLANVLAIPIMGIIVMPAAILAVIGLPFGLEGIGLTVMHYGLSAIIHVAEFVSNLPMAVRRIHSPNPSFLPLFSTAMAIFVIWRGWLKIIPAGFAVYMIVTWAAAPRPDILISDNAQLVGVMVDGKRALNRAKGAGFVARVWLENDGDGAAQVQAAARDMGGTGVQWYDHKELPIIACEKDKVYILNDWRQKLDCPFFDKSKLRRMGAVAGYVTPQGGIKWLSTRDVAGVRLWTGP